MSNLSATLNRRVTIEIHTIGQDEIGAPINTWQTFATVWANIKNQNGSQVIKGGAESSLVHASIRIRYRADINSGMRVLYSGTYYNIQSVLPDLIGKAHIDLVCQIVK